MSAFRDCAGESREQCSECPDATDDERQQMRTCRTCVNTCISERSEYYERTSGQYYIAIEKSRHPIEGLLMLMNFNIAFLASKCSQELLPKLRKWPKFNQSFTWKHYNSSLLFFAAVTELKTQSKITFSLT